MDVTTDTKLKPLLDAHPALVDFLVGYNPAFGKLTNPVLRQTVLRVASVADAAKMADLDPERLAADIAAEIARTGEVAGAASASNASVAADRQELLKTIVRELHDGASVEDVKARFDELVKDVDSTEIAAMEQAIIAEGVPVEDVMRLCDVHVSVFKEALDAAPLLGGEAPGHPVATYRRENEALAARMSAVREALEAAPSDPTFAPALAGRLAELAKVDIHYTRKENQLFPLLEEHGVTGPTQVMWGLHDDIRDRLKTAIAALGRGDTSVLEALPETLRMIDDMVYKEEHILFPVALETLSDAEWAAMAAGEAEIGFAWIDGPDAEYVPEAARQVTAADIHAAETVAPAERAAAAGDGELPLVTGRLTLEQLNLMLSALPIDVTYVDADDRVRFYSEGHRVFPRSPAVIGRAVANCHPPASVDKVLAILEAFRAGTKDTAEFWITMNGRFLSIRYFALRDAGGAYEGCLEVTQDLTDLRALEGERRLLDW